MGEYDQKEASRLLGFESGLSELAWLVGYDVFVLQVACTVQRSGPLLYNLTRWPSHHATKHSKRDLVVQWRVRCCYRVVHSRLEAWPHATHAPSHTWPLPVLLRVPGGNNQCASHRHGSAKFSQGFSYLLLFWSVVSLRTASSLSRATLG